MTYVSGGLESNIIRAQITALNGAKHLVERLTMNDDPSICMYAARAIANLAYNHSLNQGRIMSEGGDSALVRQLGLFPDNDLVKAGIMTALANLAHTEVNQMSIGYSEALPLLVQYTVQSTCPELLFACTNAMASLMYAHLPNKNRFALQRAPEALLYLISEPERFHHDVHVLASACRALCTFALTEGNWRLVRQHDGSYPLVQLCQTTHDDQLLRASAQAIAALVPSEGRKYELLQEGLGVPVEADGGIKALERCSFTAFTERGLEVPKWLTNALRIMKTPMHELKQNMHLDWYGETSAVHTRGEGLTRTELFDRTELSVEYRVEIEPDPLCHHFFTTAVVQGNRK